MERSLHDFALDVPAGAASATRPGSPAPAAGQANPERQAALEEPAPRDRSFAGRIAIAEWLLKHRDYLLAQIQAGREVHVIMADLLLVALLPTACYGLVTGLATNSVVRILTNPIKLPMVLVFTMVLCLPTLYIFSSYLGGRRSFLQTAALGFTGTAIIGVVLAAFAPITWFLTFTAPGAHALHVLVNVAVLALGGFMGVAFLLHGTRKLNDGSPHLAKQLGFLWSWIVLYGLVGAQMGWLMSPFFSSSNLIVSHRTPADGTVFTAIWRLVQQLIGG
jgi:hypothetical protein